MPRPKPSPTRAALEIDWPFFGELCRALALHVSRRYDPDVVVGIAKAGVIPAAIVATILRREFVAIVISRPLETDPPQLVIGPPDSLRGKRVLLVDETCDSGDTMKLALHELQQVGPAEIRTAVSFRTGSYLPDFFAFETEKAIVLPWDREIIENGELVPRPDLSLFNTD